MHYSQSYCTYLPSSLSLYTHNSPSIMTPEEFNETTIRCGRILKCSDEVTLALNYLLYLRSLLLSIVGDGLVSHLASILSYRSITSQ